MLKACGEFRGVGEVVCINYLPRPRFRNAFWRKKKKLPPLHSFTSSANYIVTIDIDRKERKNSSFGFQQFAIGVPDLQELVLSLEPGHPVHHVPYHGQPNQILYPQHAAIDWRSESR